MSSPTSDDGSEFLYDSSASWRSLELPPSMVKKEGMFRNTRGQKLSYLALFPSQESEQDTPAAAAKSHEAHEQRRPRVRGAVVFLHGVFEHSRRHLPLFERLCEGGFCVLTYDLVSHGQSESCEHRRRGHARRFRYFVDDTNDFVAFAKRSILPDMLQLDDEHAVLPPLIISGVSFGTLVAIHTVLSGQHAFAAMALASPIFAFDLTPTERLQSTVFITPASAVAPKIAMPKTALPTDKRYDFLCRDHAYVDDLLSDKFVIQGNLTVRMSNELVKAAAALLDDPRIVEDADSKFAQVPVLLMMGSADVLASVPQTVAHFERMQNRDKEFKVFTGLFHVLYEDPEKEEVFRHLLRWLKERFPPPPDESSGVWLYSP